MPMGPFVHTGAGTRKRRTQLARRHPHPHPQPSRPKSTRSRPQAGAYAALVEAQVQRTAEKLSIGIEAVHELLNTSARSRFRRAVLGVNAASRFATAGKVASASKPAASTGGKKAGS